jgi:hypothetical protein
MKTATCPRTYLALAAELDALQRDLGLLRYDDTNASQSARLGEAQHLVVRARALVLSVEREPHLDPCTCFTGLCTACLARALERESPPPLEAFSRSWKEVRGALARELERARKEAEE